MYRSVLKRLNMRPTKRDELVQKALKAFYRNGFNATGMDMLVKETGISKTSMYKHFRTKEDLILAVLRLRDEQFRNWLYRRMEELADTPQQQLIAMFDALEEWFAEAGYNACLSRHPQSFGSIAIRFTNNPPSTSACSRAISPS